MNHVIKPSSGQHWDILDGLRGLAILMVVACHGVYANPEGATWQLWLSDFISSGGIGVQMFFVLSGFLISYPFFKARDRSLDAWYQPGYATRRCLKIIPPYVVCIVLFAAFYYFERGDAAMVKTGLLWLVGVPHVVNIERAMEFNGSFWSLWVEIGFYALLPFAFRWTRGRDAMRSATVIGGLLIGVSVGASFLSWPDAPQSVPYMVYLNGRFPNGLANFGWGILFAGWFVRRQTQKAASPAGGKRGYAGLGLLLAALLWQTVVFRTGLDGRWFAHALATLLTGLATLLLLFLLLEPHTLAARVFSARWLKYLGIISYEWFLLHQPVIHYFRRSVGHAQGNLLTYLFIVVTPMILTLIAAAIMYEFFSAPIIEWGRARLAKARANPS